MDEAYSSASVEVAYDSAGPSDRTREVAPLEPAAVGADGGGCHAGAEALKSAA